jgi:hypothetical protein
VSRDQQRRSAAEIACFDAWRDPNPGDWSFSLPEARASRLVKSLRFVDVVGRTTAAGG